MRCTDCGHDNREGARFCDSCGAELAAFDASTAGDAATAISLSPDFVGRHREMTKLVSALDDATAGHGRLVMLAGEPGIGKTRTAQELAAIAEHRGAQVLWGHCHEGEGAPPYWPWVQLVRAYVREKDADQLRSEMGRGAADIAEIVSEVRDKLPDLEPPPDLEPDGARFRFFDSITTFLKNAATGGGLILVLDDLHWADASSLLLLEFVAREIGGCPLLLVGTYRDVEVSRRHPLSQSLGNLVRQELFLLVELRGLGQDDVGQMLSARGATLPDALIASVHNRTEGNPLFVGELARLLEREGQEGEEGRILGLPEGIRGVIGRRLDRLSEACNDILTIASVIGREFDFVLLARLSDGVTEDELLEMIDQALEAGVIEEVEGGGERYQFGHGLIQQILYEELSTSRRVRMHGRIGEALEGLYGLEIGERAAELASHFAEAEPVVGPEKLVRYSAMAGERALASYAWEDALAYFEQALAAKEGQPIDAETAGILSGIGLAQAAMARRVDARESLTSAFNYYVEVGNRTRALEIVESLPVGAVFMRLADLTARALELVPSDSLQEGRVLCRYGLDLGQAEFDYPGALEAFGRAIAIAQREKDPDLEMRVLGYAAAVHGNEMNFQECLRVSLRGVELSPRVNNPYLEALVQYWAAHSYIALGDLEKAQHHAAAGLEAAEIRRDRFQLGEALKVNQGIAFLRGEWQASREFCDRGLPLMAGGGLRVRLEYEVGNFDDADRYMSSLLRELERPVRLTGYQQLTSPVEAIPLVARITGDSDQLDLATRIARSMLSSPLRPMDISRIRTALALIAVQQGDGAAAQEQYAALKSRPVRLMTWNLTSVDRLLGLLAAAIGKLDVAADHYEDGLQFCSNAGYRAELAWTGHDYADMLLHRNGPGDRQKAMDMLDEAVAITTELGMKPLMERATALRERAESAPARAPVYPDGLTAREVEVLRLIASGKTNQQIAEELVISLNTVLRHVSNIFGKTGSANRADATSYAHRQDLV